MLLLLPSPISPLQIKRSRSALVKLRLLWLLRRGCWLKKVRRSCWLLFGNVNGKDLLPKQMHCRTCQCGQELRRQYGFARKNLQGPCIQVRAGFITVAYFSNRLAGLAHRPRAKKIWGVMPLCPKRKYSDAIEGTGYGSHGTG